MVRDAGLIFGRCARESAKQPGLTFVAPTVLALFIVVVFQAIYGDIAEVPGFPVDGFIDWVAPGAVLLTVFLGGGTSAAALIRDAQSGYLDRLRLLPVRPASLLLGRVAFDAVRALPPAAAVLGATLLLGATNVHGVAGFAAVLVLAALLGVAWNGLFYWVAFTSLSPASLQGLQPLFMPITMFSTFWVPTGFMPDWYAEIATHNPFTPLFDAARSIMLGDVDWGAVGVSVAVLAALAGVTYLLAARAFGRLVAAN